MVANLLVTDGYGSNIALESLPEDRIKGFLRPQLEGINRQHVGHNKLHLLQQILGLCGLGQEHGSIAKATGTPLQQPSFIKNLHGQRHIQNGLARDQIGANLPNNKLNDILLSINHLLIHKDKLFVCVEFPVAVLEDEVVVGLGFVQEGWGGQFAEGVLVAQWEGVGLVAVGD
jgi:hypothetical protein